MNAPRSPLRVVGLLLVGLAGCGPDVPPPDPSPARVEGCSPRLAYADRDGDGHADPGSRTWTCAEVAALPLDDCDDARGDVHPGADERCDGVDQDCDGTADEDAIDVVAWFVDVDEDGFGDGEPVIACAAPIGYAAADGDCDDADPATYPGAPEDGCVDTVDRDCDGTVAAPPDRDGDGDPACTDCDDADPARHAAAVERCDGVDQDCDGEADDDAVDGVLHFHDRDGDGWGAVAGSTGCAPGPGEVTRDGDCDDDAPGTYPGAPELCDGRSTSCGPVPVAEADIDRDGFMACAGDCRDWDADVHPGAFDACDGVDQDCDGFHNEDTLGDGAACGAASCTELATWRPDRPDGPAWITPTRGAGAQVTCSQTLAGGGWMQCARIRYTADVGTVTWDSTGAEIGRSAPWLGSTLGAGTTRAIARSCFDAGAVERGLGVVFTPDDGAPSEAFFSFDANLTSWTRAVLTAGPGCSGGTIVPATVLSGDARWLALSDGRRRVTCAGDTGRGLWLAPTPDGLWLDLSDDAGDTVGTLSGAIGTPRDGELTVWVRVTTVEEWPTPATARAHEPATVEVLPTRACRSTAPTLTLTEGAADAGLDYVAPWPNAPVPASRDRDRHVGGGVAVEDLTGDDVPDIVFTAPWGQPALYVNDGTGSFTRVPDAGLTPPGSTLDATAVDLDDDGLRDVVLAGSAGVYPFRNLGGGRFAAEAPLWVAPTGQRATVVAWTDHNADGWLDAYIGVGAECFYDRYGFGCRAADVVLEGVGPFAFQDVSAWFGPTSNREGFALAASWFDADDDGDLDAWVGNDGGGWHVPNKVFLNPGSAGVAWPERSTSTGLAAGMAAMGIAFGDLDDTGSTTVYVTNVYNQAVFTRTPGTVFSLTTTTALHPGLPGYPGFLPASWGMELADLDHDGDLDATVAWSWLMPSSWWLGSHSEAYLASVTTPMPAVIAERRPGTFVKRPDLLADAPQSWAWRTAIPVDVDADGALDVLFTSSMGPVSLQRGACTPAHWLEVAPRQTGGNRDALGTRVELWSEHTDQWRLIGVGGTGAQSGREPVAHFGLGADTQAHLRIIWPDGVVSVIRDVAADQRVRVVR